MLQAGDSNQNSGPLFTREAWYYKGFFNSSVIHGTLSANNSGISMIDEQGGVVFSVAYSDIIQVRDAMQHKAVLKTKSGNFVVSFYDPRSTQGLGVFKSWTIPNPSRQYIDNLRQIVQSHQA